MSTQTLLFGESEPERKKSKRPASLEGIAAAGFDVRTFVENFGVLAEAGDAAARIREFVLDLACKGLLCAQEKADEPAEFALRRILASQKHAEGAGQLDRVPKALPIGADEIPHGLPSGWAWTRLCAGVLSIQIGPFGSLLHQSDYVSGGTPLINPAHIKDGRIVPEAKKGVAKNTLARLSGYRVWAGDIVMGRRGEMGKCAVITSVEDGWLCGTGSLFVRPTSGVEPSFIALWLRSPAVRARLDGESVGSTMNNLNLRILNNLVLGMPPVAEQKRIVVKVDELMALIDDLEAQQTKKREVGARLTKSALDALTSAEGPEEFDAAWKRVVENFDVLIDRAEKVSELRSAVVSLALRGRLDKHRHSDGDVEELVAALGAASHEQMGDDLPAIPSWWQWFSLGELLTMGPKNGYSPKSVEYETKVRSLTLTATTSGKFDGRFSKYIDEEIPPESELWLEDGDVLIQRGNTIEYVGVAAVYRGPSQTFIYPDLMMKMRLSDQVDTMFVHLALNGSTARAFIVSRASGTSGTMPKINQATVTSIPVPVPPLEEQRRIVAKVDSLMKVCDELEAKLARAEDRAAKLAEAAVRELVA